MRIALVSTLAAPVKQDSWGSVEAWTWLLARELGTLGHQVTVFGCAGAEVPCEMVATMPGPYGAPGSYEDWELCEWVNLCRAVELSHRFEVLHSQAYFWGMPLQKLSRAPMLHTLHVLPDVNAARLWENTPGAHVTALSWHQWQAHPHLKPRAIVPHGVDINQFTFQPKPEDYVLYLGRFTSGKGPLLAIQAARAAGVPLIMAGPEDPYFREHVKPLVDGKTVQYVGYAGPAERNRLLGGAKALVYPLRYGEPFGLVLAEAMLCGTPIAAMRLGAVSEIIEEGLSGFMTTDDKEFAGLIHQCFALDRKRVRQRAEERFSAQVMARRYAEVYEQISQERSRSGL